MFEPELGREFSAEEELVSPPVFHTIPRQSWDDPIVSTVQEWIQEGRTVWAKVDGVWREARPTMITGDDSHVLIKFKNSKETEKEFSTAISINELMAWQAERGIEEKNGGDGDVIKAA
jgi:hypothetical protein